MNKKRSIKKTISFAKKKMSNRESGHDWMHTERVYKVAQKIAHKEKADVFIVEMAALLHDVFDFKFYDERIAEEKIAKYLDGLDLNWQAKKHIESIVSNISFKGARVKNNINTLEGKVVQDADRLDAIGAIGIARVFSYGGHDGRVMYDPKIKPVLHTTFKNYKNGKSTSINHFYEKLLLLKDRMNTKTAKKMAIERHNFMKKYLDQFYKEWEDKL
jgi:uncharacterized protein